LVRICIAEAVSFGAASFFIIYFLIDVRFRLHLFRQLILPAIQFLNLQVSSWRKITDMPAFKLFKQEIISNFTASYLVVQVLILIADKKTINQ